LNGITSIYGGDGVFLMTKDEHTWPVMAFFAAIWVLDRTPPLHYQYGKLDVNYAVAIEF
jgi:hypothetical protein